jgi:hypothetical protein
MAFVSLYSKVIMSLAICYKHDELAAKDTSPPRAPQAWKLAQARCSSELEAACDSRS